MPHATAASLIRADPYPGLLCRLLGPFAQQDLVPVIVRSRRTNDCLTVRIVQDDLDHHRALIIAEKMRSLVGVRAVRLPLPPL